MKQKTNLLVGLLVVVCLALAVDRLGLAARSRGVIKVKTFACIDPTTVDDVVNEWLSSQRGVDPDRIALSYIQNCSALLVYYTEGGRRRTPYRLRSFASPVPGGQYLALPTENDINDFLNTTSAVVSTSEVGSDMHGQFLLAYLYEP